MRDKHDEGIKEMCSTGIRFGRSDTATWSVMVDGCKLSRNATPPCDNTKNGCEGDFGPSSKASRAC